MKRLFLIPLLIAAFIPGQAMAYDWVVTTKVAFIEGSFVPENLPFGLANNSNSNCSRLSWSSIISDAGDKTQNMQAVYALLVTAMAGNKSITVYGNNDCTVNYIYLNAS